jgi:DNA-binding response OmpR family regulator
MSGYEQPPPTPQTEIPLIPPNDRPPEPQPQRLLEPVDKASVDRAYAELEAVGRVRERRRRQRIELFFDRERREVRVTGRTIRLSYSEFEVFRLLANNPYWPFSTREVADGVAAFDCGVTLDNVDEYVASLRDKLGDFADYIQTVPGFGYRFRE